MAGVGSKRVARGASHLAKLLAVGDLHEVNAVLRAERLDQLRVRRLVATLRQHAQLPLGLVERLAALVEAAAKAVVAEGVLQDLLKRRLHVHRRLRGSGLRSLHNCKRFGSLASFAFGVLLSCGGKGGRVVGSGKSP